MLGKGSQFMRNSSLLFGLFCFLIRKSAPYYLFFHLSYVILLHGKESLGNFAVRKMQDVNGF